MRQGGLRLGRILGIEVSANLGVLVIGALLAWSLAATVLPSNAPGMVDRSYWAAGVLGALLFLGSLLAHELAHSVVAQRNGVEVRGITLWMFGGVSEMAEDPATPGADFRITAAGPATSLALGGIFLGIGAACSAVGVQDIYVVLTSWLGLINLVLGVFNLLPGAPLDGGRLVAVGLWKWHGDRLRGQIGAAKAGRVVGIGLVGLGIAEMYQFGGFSGLWTILIGWFLFNTARNELAYYDHLRSIEQLAAPPPPPRSPPTQRWTAPGEQQVHGTSG